MRFRVSALSDKGFYRCGAFFPKSGRVVAEGDFTDGQMRRLMEDPNLLIGPETDDGGDDRLAVIIDAIDTLPLTAYTRAGLPKVKAVSAALGERVTAAQVEAAWAAKLAAE